MDQQFILSYFPLCIIYDVQ